MLLLRVLVGAEASFDVKDQTPALIKSFGGALLVGRDLHLPAIDPIKLGKNLYLGDHHAAPGFNSESVGSTRPPNDVPSTECES